MKRIFFLLALKASVLCASSYPEQVPIIEREYSIGYDARNKNPQWIYERITKECLQGCDDRENCQFKEDPSIPKIFRSCLADYRNSGFDRGHLAPAANHKNSMDETFYLSNMCPQNPKFNRGYWKKLENHVRDLTKEFDVIEVISGPLYLPQEETDGKRYVRYEVIGKNDVAVPTHFFKVISIQDHQGKVLDTLGYILPNEEINLKTPLERFKTTIEKIETTSGLIFKNLKK